MHLFLSPHYDDAVLSCGGIIHRLVQQGQAVTVQTVMGGQPLPETIPDSPVVRELHARWQSGESPVLARRAEDQTAVKSLGAVATHMDMWADCIYRRSAAHVPLYPTGESIFGAVHRDDIAAHLLHTLVLISEEPITHLYVPLGVGEHVDHLLVRTWGLELVKQYRWIETRFYEDYPYCEKPEALSAALDYYAGLGLTMQSETIPLDEYDVFAKVQAVGLYASQVSSFWHDSDMMERAIRRQAQATGETRPAERLWHISRATTQEES